MIPYPLHPAIVHFPIVFAVLLPLLAVGALVRRRNDARRRVWLPVVALSVGLVASAWIAVQTGETQEEVVEDVLVSEAPLHGHEEAGETFLALSFVTMGLVAIGLLEGRVGHYGRVVAAVATLVTAGAGYQVGHTGGELVYRHGAAAAYTSGIVPRTESSHEPGEEDRQSRGDEHRDGAYVSPRRESS